MLGRTFLPDEDKPGGNLAVVLGHGLWQRVFAGNSNIVGQTVTLDNNNRRRNYTVAGVMPPGFGHPPNSALWVSASGISNFPMNRFFPDTDAMIRWIDQPSLLPFLPCVVAAQWDAFRADVIARMIRETRQEDGRCFETFRRINVFARK